jgi:hypothetical protein
LKVSISESVALCQLDWQTLLYDGVLNQYRAHFRSLVGELSLSPSSASRLGRPESDDGEDRDPFD